MPNTDASPRLSAENRLDVPAIAEKQVLAAINAVLESSCILISVVVWSRRSTKTIPHIHLLPANEIIAAISPLAQGGPTTALAGGETVVEMIVSVCKPDVMKKSNLPMPL